MSTKSKRHPSRRMAKELEATDIGVWNAVLAKRKDLMRDIGPDLVRVAQKYRGTEHEKAVRECWEAAVMRILVVLRSIA